MFKADIRFHKGHKQIIAVLQVVFLSSEIHTVREQKLK